VLVLVEAAGRGQLVVAIALSHRSPAQGSRRRFGPPDGTRSGDENLYTCTDETGNQGGQVVVP
jgi:hypothetical protein